MNSSRKESERTKFVQEKCQTLLTLMLRDEDNKYCVDCDAKGPRWASWNLGVFLCIRCAGIHRNLGVHISRVKSVNLDTWTPEQVVSLQQMGNSRARAVYEAQMPDGFRRPQTDSTLESFIRAKYEHKKYVAREWVQPPPAKANWDKEIDEEMEKQKRKKKGLGIASTTIAKSTDGQKSAASFKATPLPAPLPKPTNNSSSPKTSSRTVISKTASANTAENTSNDTKPSYSSDLLGLSTHVNGPSITDSKKAANDLNNSNDVFGCFLSEPAVNANIPNNSSATSNGLAATLPAINHQGNKQNSLETSLAQQEQDFFNQIPNEKEKAKMTKDSILALYGTAPSSIGRFNPPTNNHHQFIPQQAMSTINTNKNDNAVAGFGALPVQYQQQPAFGMTNTTGLGNYQQMGLLQQQQSKNVNSLTNHAIGGFGTMATAPTTSIMQPQQFAQQIPNLSFPSTLTTATNPNNINQPFGNLNLGNVWQ